VTTRRLLDPDEALRRLETRLGPLHAQLRLGIEREHEAQAFGIFPLARWALRRRVGDRTRSLSINQLVARRQGYTAHECANYFANAGYGQA
jgi:hypothetical protein